jgi:fibronectin type III domain protein
MHSRSREVRSSVIRAVAKCFTATSVVLVAAVAIPVGAATAATPIPSATALPLTIDDGPVPNAVATSVSCPVAGSCVAVGSFQDTIGITHAATYALSSGVWTAAQELAPTGTPDYTFSDLNSVSCVSVGNCVAVGDYRISTVQTEGFYAVETSGVWARGVELPLPSDVQSTPAQTTFVSASCILGGTTCQLLGDYVTNSIPAAIHAVVDTYVFGTGITGPPAEIAQLSGEDGIELSGISCATSTSCVAVGSQTRAFASEATTVAETSGSWGVPIVLANPNGAAVPYEFLTSVSCPTSGNCVAAGLYGDTKAGIYAETYTETSGTWGAAVDIGQPAHLNFPYIDDVSCVTTVTTCTLVGALSDSQGALHAATAQLTGGRWGQLAPAGVPAGAISDHELLGVSCTTGVQCTAVGYYNLNTVTGGTDAMAATWSVGVPPGAVTGLHKQAATSTAASLAWTAPGNPGVGIDHYEITATQLGAAPVDEGPALGTSSVVSKLSPGGTYHLSVVTVATDGQTSAPVALTVVLPATVPSAPKIVRVTGVHQGLHVSWLAPKSTGGATITSYVVSATCSGAVRQVRFPGSARQGDLTGLRMGGTCVVRVAAHNRAGTGQISGPAVGRPLA